MLNDYGILNRGYAWSTRMIVNIIKTKLPNVIDSILNNSKDEDEDDIDSNEPLLFRESYIDDNSSIDSSSSSDSD